MTLPVSAGYPDYGRAASEAQILEINDFTVTNSGTVNYPIRYVGNAKALQVWISAATMGMVVSLEFFADSAGIVSMDSYILEMRSGDIAKQPVPILGPYMGVILIPAAGTPNTYTLQVWRTPELARFAGASGDVAMFNDVGLAIGAGATITRDCRFIMEGHAVCTAFSPSSNWQAVITALDHNGVGTVLDLITGAANTLVQHQMYLPPWHIQLQVTNFAAGASTYSFLMTRKHNQ